MLSTTPPHPPQPLPTSLHYSSLEQLGEDCSLKSTRLTSCYLVTQSGRFFCGSMVCSPTRLLCPWNFPGKNTRGGSRFLLQGIFQTQGLNLVLLHCRWILYHLSHQGSLTVSQSLLKFMSTGSVMLSNVSSSAAPFSFCLQPFPASGSFTMNQLFTSGGPSIGASVSAISLSNEYSGLIPLGMTGLISLQFNIKLFSFFSGLSCKLFLCLWSAI